MDPELNPETETATETAPATIDANAEVKALAERATIALESLAKSLFVIESAYVQMLRNTGHKIG